MFRSFLLFFFMTLQASMLFSQPVSQFRGPYRTGVFMETGLMESWPASGPELLWRADSIGNGFCSPVVTGDRIFLASEMDSIGYLFALDKSGKLLCKTATGREWTENFPGPRSSPTIAGDLLYYCSSMGAVMCLETATGRQKWSRHLVGDLHGINIRFGHTESLLIDGDKVYCSPGGTDTNVVALNRFDGTLIWKSKAMGDSAAYCSPVVFQHNGRKILSTLTIHHLIGLDAENGALLWNQPMERPGDIHCNIPLYHEGALYCNDRGGNGMLKFVLSPGGDSITEIWRNFKAGNVQSGFIRLGDFLYGSRYRPARFESNRTDNGKTADSLKFAVGSVIFADRMLYCYGEDGTMGLIRPDSGKLTLVSSFKIVDGSREHFAHPAIGDGVLYVRHGNALMAYDIRKKKE